MTPGNYTVTYTPTTIPAGYLPTTPVTLAVTLAASQQYSDADFGLIPPGIGSIGDYIWLDKNSDGIQDVEEAPLAGIKVNLELWVVDTSPELGSWVAVATDTTDVDGLYLFEGLQPGDYRVVVDTTSAVTSPYAAGPFTLGAAMAPTYDLDGIITPNTTLVTLGTGTGEFMTYDTVDFGYNWNGSIGDTVWWDYNPDGIQDIDGPDDIAGNADDETGIPDAYVLLYFDADGNGLLEPSQRGLPGWPGHHRCQRPVPV